jgi:hypothetical protein
MSTTLFLVQEAYAGGYVYDAYHDASDLALFLVAMVTVVVILACGMGSQPEEKENP